MVRKRKKAEVSKPTEVVQPYISMQNLGQISTRNLERPKGSIRIVPGRKDAK